MSKKIIKYRFLRSNELGKRPLPEQMVEGELAMNFAEGSEELYIKNANGKIVSFKPNGSSQPVDDFYLGCNSITTLSNVPITKRLVMANINANQSFTLASLVESGKEIHIIAKNTGKKNITVSLPTAGIYVNLGDTALTLKASETREINIISDGKKAYIRTV